MRADFFFSLPILVELKNLGDNLFKMMKILKISVLVIRKPLIHHSI
jgi:hypothetical protein